MVKVGKADLKVSDARKILTNFNKTLREEGFGKRAKGGEGVYRMGTAKLEQELKMFKISKDGKSVKHKVKKDWSYVLPASKLPPVAKTAKKVMKKQTKKDKKDESKGMKGQKKGTTSKTAPKNFEKKKKAPAKGKVKTWAEFVKMKGGPRNIKKGEWASYKKKNKL